MRNLLKNIKIRTKIFLLLGLTLTLMSLVTVAGLWQVNVIGKEMTTLTKLNVPLTEVLSKITYNSMEQKIHFEHAVKYGKIMAQDPTAKDNFEIEREKFLKYGQTTIQEIAKGREFLGQLLGMDSVSHTQESTPLVDYELRNISKEHSNYQFAAKRVLNLLAQGKSEQGQTTIEKIGKTKKGHSSLENLLVAIKDFIQDRTGRAQKNKQTAIIGMLLFSTVILVFGLGLGIFISRSISRPLQLAVDIARHIAAGDRDLAVEGTATDETGQLLKTMKEMSYSINEKEEALRHANIGLHAEITQRKKLEKYCRKTSMIWSDSTGWPWAVNYGWLNSNRKLTSFWPNSAMKKNTKVSKRLPKSPSSKVIPRNKNGNKTKIDNWICRNCFIGRNNCSYSIVLSKQNY